MDDRIDLTPRQRELLELLRRGKRRIGPTIRELCAAMEIKSANGVLCLLRVLVKKGWVEQLGEASTRGYVAVEFGRRVMGLLSRDDWADRAVLLDAFGELAEGMVWAHATFHPDNDLATDARECFDHLREELDEAACAETEAKLRTDVVDILMLSAHLALRVCGRDLGREIRRKVEINRGRTWRRARSGVIGHESQRKAELCPACGVRLDGATCVKCGATWPGHGEGTA